MSAGFRVEYAPRARKQFLALPKAIQEQLGPAIDALADDPHPAGCKKLKGSDVDYRIRVGSYRVLYEVMGKCLVILVFRVAHRKDAYR
jgi:mRNA interferase RelE/StbE